MIAFVQSRKRKMAVYISMGLRAKQVRNMLAIQMFWFCAIASFKFDLLFTNMTLSY
ncbi:FtsX-like permease family protein [Paenibacillus paeoniae]|uniref:FtsX-like permease family protein n=1 Tax=Paenibacillus paeoniae TaxID=2292705 RepID=UPI003B832635